MPDLALLAGTGERAWSIQAERWQEGLTITAAPLYYDGMVIVDFAGGENGIRGRVKAFDAKDGRLLWTFYTIPGPESEPDATLFQVPSDYTVRTGPRGGGGRGTAR